MKRIILSISIILFFYSCNSGGSSSVGPDVEPVYTVNMGLSGVGSNFAADPEAQGSFIDALAVQLGISFNRIQIVNITTQRGSVNIELLFLESLDSSEPSVSNILDNIADTILSNISSDK